jgi:hypothetical protein
MKQLSKRGPHFLPRRDPKKFEQTANSQSSIKMLAAKFIPVIKTIMATPLVLKGLYPEVIQRLQTQGNADSQGTGNKVMPHEAAFAVLLESSGFTWIPKKKKNDHLKDLPKSGFYYIYQANGSQAAVDFEVFSVEAGAITESYKIDCKQSTSETIMLNDGWFHSDTLYVMTWASKKVVKNMVAFGNTFITKDDDELYKDTRRIIADLNAKPKKGINFLRYFRCANQFSMKAIDSTFVQWCVLKSIQRLKAATPAAEPPPPPSQEAPHSPPEQPAPSSSP